MRKLIFIGIVAVGALVGLLSAAEDDWVVGDNYLGRLTTTILAG